MIITLLKAIKVFKDYYECPHNCGATYHQSVFDSREYECRDCRKSFLVPDEVKIKFQKPVYKKQRD